MDCGNLHVPPAVMQHVAHVESSFNPYAIGVVKGRLTRQPRNLQEALQTVKMLEEAGYNFSVGIAQVNRYNLKKYGLGSYEKAFDVCSNLLAGSKILKECYISAKNDWGKAFSCYYSGNFITGYRHGYVQKIFNSIKKYGRSAPTVSNRGIQIIKEGSKKAFVPNTLNSVRYVLPKNTVSNKTNHSSASNSAAARFRADSPGSENHEQLQDNTFVF